MSKRYYTVHCNGCQALAINGVATHERGCPHQDKRWVTRVRGFTCPVMFPENEPPKWAMKEETSER